MDLTHTSRKALEMLCDSPDGFPFSQLGISNTEFLALVDMGYLAEPDGAIINNNFDHFAVHNGNVRITYSGKVLIERLREAEKLKLDNKNEQCRKEAKEDSQKKRDRMFDFLLVVIGSILALLVEHFSKILAWISAVFHR